MLLESPGSQVGTIPRESLSDKAQKSKADLERKQHNGQAWDGAGKIGCTKSRITSNSRTQK